MEYRLNSPDVVQEELDGEVIVVHLVSGSYYSLTRGGADVWRRLIAGQTAGAIVDQLTETTEGTRPVIGPAVEQFIADLVAEQLIVPTTGRDHSPVLAPATPGERSSFEAPRFEKFTDMQELLLVDPIHEVAEAGWPLQPNSPESGAVPPG
ncbi:MAG: PqqD family protein [Planctomycetaceae bacterium]